MTQVAQPTALADQRARDRIAGVEPADLDRSFAIEAGAGSGKTTELVKRLVALAERDDSRGELDDPLAEVVAISFTNRAAAELRAQAYRGLAARAAALSGPGGEGRRQARIRRALARLDTACIDTIHGFCGRILRAEALAIGLPPDYAVLDEREADEERLAFWRGYVAHTPDDEIAEVGLAPADLRPLFLRLCTRLGRLPSPYEAPRPELESATELASQRVAEWQALRPEMASLGGRDDLQRALDRAERLREYRGLESPLDQARFIEAVLRGYDERRRQGRVREDRWPDRERARSLASFDLPHLVDSILPAHRAWQAYAYDRSLAFALEALRVFESERFGRGRITQDDVLLLTARLLRDFPRVRRRAAERYRRILVDEFQDTDPIQAEILFLLAAEDADVQAPETNWRKTRPRSGSLFLVGDPKQAIYRFRGADIQTYSEARRVLLAAGGEGLELTTCFRSTPAICDWVNGCLSAPFAQDLAAAGGTARQAPYVPLVSNRAGVAAARPFVARIDVRPMSKPRPDLVAARDSKEIARFIRAAVDRRAAPALYPSGGEEGAVFGDEARYGDFLILCRSAYRFRRYALALEEKGIPYALAGDKGLGESAELRALVDLLDAVRDPLDGPVVVAQRTGLLGGFDTPMLVGNYKEGLSREAAEHVQAVRELCRAARVALDELPLGAAFEWVVQHTGLLSVAAGRDRGASTRSGSILKVLALARTYESAGLHWTEASDRLREIVSGERKDGRITLEEGAPDAVRIMTLHQAKGLQSPVVFLADPYSTYDPGPSEHAGRNADGTSFLTAPLTAGGDFTTRVVAAPARWFASDESEERLFEDAERRRIAYVAATRTQGLLIVSRYLGPGRSLAGTGAWGLFHDGLDDAPHMKDLFVEAGGLPHPQVVTGPVASGRDFTEERRAALGRASHPSYRTSAVTADEVDVDEEIDALERAGGDSRRAGHGAPFGSAVHALFEWAIRSRHTESIEAADIAQVERLWMEWRPDVQRDEAFAALAALRGSDLWRRLLAADDVLAEAHVAGLESIGAIDLAYRDAAGWHLVDFKTDVVMDESAATEVVERHAGQVRAYAAIWAAATGELPASLALYLTDTGQTYGVSSQ